MIEVNENLSRDAHSKALLSSNRKRLDEHRHKIKQSNDINTLKEDVKNLTQLLEVLIKKIDRT